MERAQHTRALRCHKKVATLVHVLGTAWCRERKAKTRTDGKRNQTPAVWASNASGRLLGYAGRPFISFPLRPPFFSSFNSCDLPWLEEYVGRQGTTTKTFFFPGERVPLLAFYSAWTLNLSTLLLYFVYTKFSTMSKSRIQMVSTIQLDAFGCHTCYRAVAIGILTLRREKRGKRKEAITSDVEEETVNKTRVQTLSIIAPKTRVLHMQVAGTHQHTLLVLLALTPHRTPQFMCL